MDSIRVSIIQTDIVWENKQENLRLLHEKLQSLRGTTEIVVLPEMFSTGFSMQSQTLAEPNSGKTISTLKQWASLFQLAICGSYIATDNGQFYNRAFPQVTNGSSVPIMGGISACLYVTISVFLCGAGTSRMNMTY